MGSPLNPGLLVPPCSPPNRPGSRTIAWGPFAPSQIGFFLPLLLVLPALGCVCPGGRG